VPRPWTGDLRPCLNPGFLKKLRIDIFEKNGPRLFKIV
jgi:hypothetical protein